MASTPQEQTVPDLSPVDDPHAQLKRQSTELLILRRVREDLSRSDDVNGIIRNAVESLATTVGYAHVSAYLVQSGGLRLLRQVGYEHALTWINLDSGVRGRVARTGRGTLVADVNADPDFVAMHPDTLSAICVPFGLGSENAGILYIEMAGPELLTDSDYRIVSEIAGLLTLAIERASVARSQRFTEHHFQLALDAAEMGVWTWSPATGVLEWKFAEDEAWISEPIQSLDELLGLADAGDFGYLEHVFSRAAVDGDLDAEFRITGDGAAPRWLNLRGQAIERAADGSPTQISGVVFDVTGRKRLEEERIRLVHLETARANAEEAQRVMVTTIERLTDGFVAIDSELNLSLVNEPAARLIGREREELLGSPLEGALTLLGDAHAAGSILHACSGGEPSSIDVFEPRADRFLEVRIFPGVDGTTLHFRDVTAIRRAENERQRYEARFRSLVQQSSDLILILDRQAVVQFASPAVQRILGFAPDELTGRVNSLTVHPGDVKRFKRQLLKVLRTPGLHPAFEIRVQHQDGSWRWLEITPTNLLADSLMQGVIANCRDITDRHESEFNLWILSEVSTVMGASLDLDQTLEALNRLLVTYTCDVSLVAVFNDRGDVEQSRASERQPRRGRRLDEAALADHAVDAIGIRSGRSLSSRHTLVLDVAKVDLSDPVSQYTGIGAALKSLAMAAAVVVPVVLRSQVRGVLMVGFGTDHDVSPSLVSMIEDVARRAGLAIENAGLYQQAREAVDARDRFLSVAAHELRTPITSVAGYTKMLRRELSDRRDPERIERYAVRLDEAGLRLNTLAEDLLDVSRIRSGLAPLRVGPVNVKELANRVATQYAEHRSSARERIRLDCEDEPAIAQVDPDRVEQVLTNLIDNALKYSPPNTEIDIITSHDDRWVRLAIKDRGIGVVPANLEAIFQPFGRAANVESSGIPGMGLGLYICRTIVERLGGSIWAESAGQDAGLTVIVQLPIAAPGADPETPE